MRQTKIIATIGPASCSETMLESLINKGVNVLRLNFSHGTYAWYDEVFARIKKVNKKFDQKVAILLDTKGPEIRTEELNQPLKVSGGDKMYMGSKNLEEKPQPFLGVNYDSLPHDAQVGETVLVDNGEIRLQVLSISESFIQVKVLDDGMIASKRHVNLPGREVSLETITEKDWEDIEYGIKQGVDFIALSFVRRAADIQTLRAYLQDQGSQAKIIAKVESYEATQHLEAIIESADALMVARGDLGAEIPYYQVPLLQRDMVEMAREMRTPVIVATHMLESMIEHPLPTRAEVSDIARAIEQGTDAIMLSGETAGGKYPERSVETMVEVAKAMDENTQVFSAFTGTDNGSVLPFLAYEAEHQYENIEAILVITKSGKTAVEVSRYLPSVPVLAFTNDVVIKRQMSLLYGVGAYVADFDKDAEKTVQDCLKKASDGIQGRVVVISDSLIEGAWVPKLEVREI